jgi:hypothetical protein
MSFGSPGSLLIPPAKSRRQYASSVILLVLFASALWVFYVTRVNTIGGDSLTAWPITEQLQHPDYYSPGDLLVQAGVSGNYLLYRLLSLVPFCRDNFPLRDLLIYIPIFLLWCAAWYLVYREVSPSRSIAAVALFLLLFSDAKMGLHRAAVPHTYLVSATSIQFAQVFGLLLFLKGRRTVSLAVIALTSYLHPGSALSLGAVLSAMLGLEAVCRRNWRPLIPLLVFPLVLVPNLLFLTSHSQGFLGNSSHLWEQLRLVAHHTYVEDYFKEGYAYTLAVAGLSMVGLAAGALKVNHRRLLFVFFAVSLAGCAVWLFNVYVTHSIPFFYTYFVTRIFYVLKPFLILFIVQLGAQYARTGAAPFASLCGALFAGTVFFFSPTVGLIIAVAMAGLMVNRTIGLASLCILIPVHLGWAAIAIGPAALASHLTLGAPFSSLQWLREAYLSMPFTWFELTVLLAVFVPLMVILARKPKAPVPAGSDVPYVSILAGILVCVVAFTQCARLVMHPGQGAKVYSPERNFGIAAAAPLYNELVNWARKSDGRLFIIPPKDDGTSVSFRFLTKKSVFVYMFDLPQLTYSPVYLDSAFARLALLNTGVEKRFVLDDSGYDSVPVATFRKTGADCVIFDRGAFTNVQGITVAPVFQNEKYVAYSIGSL